MISVLRGKNKKRDEKQRSVWQYYLKTCTCTRFSKKKNKKKTKLARNQNNITKNAILCLR